MDYKNTKKTIVLVAENRLKSKNIMKMFAAAKCRLKPTQNVHVVIITITVMSK